MQNITSFQILGALVVSLIGFAFRLGIFYESKKKLPAFMSVFFLFIFSTGCAGLAFLYVIEKEWSATLKLIPIFFASFFGSIVVTGLGEIKPDFFKELFKDFLRKWLNSKTGSNDNTNETTQEIDTPAQADRNME
ncbi:MAG: hypothetical protein JSS64_08485 [Bacteroidetes bacterium]|nr:hypothetical protein [Bacteroidota bacterium]